MPPVVRKHGSFVAFLAAVTAYRTLVSIGCPFTDHKAGILELAELLRGASTAAPGEAPAHAQSTASPDPASCAPVGSTIPTTVSVIARARTPSSGFQTCSEGRGAASVSAGGPEERAAARSSAIRTACAATSPDSSVAGFTAQRGAVGSRLLSRVRRRILASSDEDAASRPPRRAAEHDSCGRSRGAEFDVGAFVAADLLSRLDLAARPAPQHREQEPSQALLSVAAEPSELTGTGLAHHDEDEEPGPLRSPLPNEPAGQHRELAHLALVPRRVQRARGDAAAVADDTGVSAGLFGDGQLGLAEELALAVALRGLGLAGGAGGHVGGLELDGSDPGTPEASGQAGAHHPCDGVAPAAAQAGAEQQRSCAESSVGSDSTPPPLPLAADEQPSSREVAQGAVTAGAAAPPHGPAHGYGSPASEGGRRLPEGRPTPFQRGCVRGVREGGGALLSSGDDSGSDGPLTLLRTVRR
jgi:hypothetical protein